jgi:hypothetical protein
VTLPVMLQPKVFTGAIWSQEPGTPALKSPEPVGTGLKDSLITVLNPGRRFLSLAGNQGFTL